MTAYIKIVLWLQALSLLWVGYIALTEGDPGTALGWVFFQFIIAPFVLLALVMLVMRWLFELGAHRL
jgi:Na+/melibiose symporter-like transporter